MWLFYVVIWILLTEVTAGTSDIKVSGHVGGHVSFSCSHSLATTNTKYFCKYPCTAESDILIKFGQTTEKYKLEDSGDGVLMVTITNLLKADTGTYWCGVDRIIKDTYIKVNLNVTDAPSAHPTKALQTRAPLRTERSKTHSSSPSSTISPSTTIVFSTSLSTLPAQHFRNISMEDTDISHGLRTTILYTGAGLIGMVIIFGLSLCTLRCKRTRESKHTDFTIIYSEIKRPQTENNQLKREDSAEETLENPLYSTVDLEEERLDSQIYCTAW